MLSASEPTTQARVLFALAALLFCAGFARAQERGGEKTEPARPPVFNVSPFEEVALAGRQLVEQGKLGPDTRFDVSATAERGADGRLRPESVSVVWHEPADEAVAALARRLLTAFSESRVLAPLDSVTTVRLALKLDRQNVSVTVALEMPTESDAEMYAEGHRLLIKTRTFAGGGTDESELYKRLGFSSEGKVFKMSFGMPRDEAARMIARMLERLAAKTAAQQD